MTNCSTNIKYQVNSDIPPYLAIVSVDFRGASTLLSGATFLHRAQQRGVCAGQKRAAQALLGGACRRRAGLILFLPAQQLILQPLHRRVWLGGHLMFK